MKYNYYIQSKSERTHRRQWKERITQDLAIIVQLNNAKYSKLLYTSIYIYLQQRKKTQIKLECVKNSKRSNVGRYVM
jgi:Mlc titration factor MtfA (ptsG expression regulator)